ncbi:hypothetical protein H310_14668 [Aphanomyces invadans]|uniref:Uncharacterized protein n=1 Tax=Aphanomyces invadans TaxID=157072 RepID=A0A024T9A0_9STRA|nr:hypothetical protein H310_14668 [Aphanomyces invadans]ETV90574.1 hypothetical protein H310_14668 [Aphanomyces invadans]|eukprot:XP_008880788.1 hypothetical protein H310_14668 [Aphanomyces invadans]
MAATNAAAKLNLFKAICGKRNFGVGQKVTRAIWDRFEETPGSTTSFIEITRVEPSPDLAHGKAYGIKTFRGVSEGKVRRVDGPLKKDWRIVA